MRLLVLILSLLNTNLSWSRIKIPLLHEEKYKPFSYKENGISKGLYIERLQKIFKQLPEYDLVLDEAPWARALKEVEDGKRAGLIGVYYRPNERPYLNLSKGFIREEVVVYCNVNSIKNRTFNKFPDDFVGMKFGNQKGYLAAKEIFFEFVKQKKIKIHEGIDFTQLLKEMLLGDTDCIINNAIVIKTALHNLEASSLPERLKDRSKKVITVSEEIAHLGFSKKYEKNHPELKKFRMEFDRAIDQTP